MNQFISNPQDSETAGREMHERLSELAGQNWSRDKSNALAGNEGITLDDAHWAVVVFLRKYYLDNGLPTHARITSRALNTKFFGLGGSKYLRRLFPGGPVTQGSRIAKLPTPAYATDLSFGTSY